MGSQLTRAFGGNDGIGLLLLVCGGALAVGGAILFLNSGSAVGSPAEGIATQVVRNDPPTATDHIGSQKPPASSATVSIEHLERLAALKERGVLTDAEFEAQKQKLLS